MRNGNALSVHELTDEEIVDALRHKDERVTRQYFYEYCRIAYCVYNKKYELDYKPGMDFFAHMNTISPSTGATGTSWRTASRACRSALG